MALTAELEIARADMNDAFGVSVWQRKKLVDYTIAQARNFAKQILNAADEAERIQQEDSDAAFESEGAEGIIMRSQQRMLGRVEFVASMDVLRALGLDDTTYKQLFDAFDVTGDPAAAAAIFDAAAKPVRAIAEAQRGPCGEDVPGTVPSWAGEDQIDPCACALTKGHEGKHICSHDIEKEAAL